MLKNKYIIWLQTIFIIFVCLFLNSQNIYASSDVNLLKDSVREKVFLIEQSGSNGEIGIENISLAKVDIDAPSTTGSAADGVFKSMTKTKVDKYMDMHTTIVNDFCGRTQLYFENDSKMPDGKGDHLITDFVLYKGIIDTSTKEKEGGLSELKDGVDSILSANTSEHNKYILKFKVESVEYSIATFSSKYQITVTYKNDPDPSTMYVNKNEIRSYFNNPNVESVSPNFTDSQLLLLEEEYKIYQDTMVALEKIELAMKLGILAGSIGSGYNVGTVYSTTQISLYDAMKLQENDTYDFKNAGALKYSFSYYMNPLAGKLDFIDTGIPTDIVTWTKYLEQKNITNFISGKDILVSDEFTAFESGLSEDQINEQGMKKTDKANFKNGVKALTDVGKSKTPGSVLSYNMKIAYPYIFYRVGNNYKLLTNTLKIDNEYMYCIYNDRIYNNKFEEITNRLELGVDRTQLFLYHQIDPTGNYVGVVLVGGFDEAVIDTSDKDKGTLYATGRKIGFNNGYSDLLTFNRANPQLMFSTSEGGKRGYLPKNVAFLPTEEEMSKINHNMVVIPQEVIEGKNKFEVISILSNTEILDELKEIGTHDTINSEPDAFKIHILLTQIINKKGKEELEENINNNNTGASSSSSSSSSGSTSSSDGANIENQMKELGLSHYAFVIIRNNKYINDSELISWLQTDTARSITYVDADTLLKKITGDFADELEKLTYEDWLKMQEIKSELQYNKDTWLIRILNVVSIVMGVFMIIFSILICLAYWIDIFNTLTDFSILQFISFGNLYPVENKDLLPYISEEKSATKYVTFKDVLIIAGICCGLAILFMNVTTLISWIVRLYNYIMFVLGGK